MRARTWMSTLGATALATALTVAGLGATTTANAAGPLLQSAGLSVSTIGVPFTSSPLTAQFTLRNNSTTASIAAFTIVVPPGVTSAYGAGVTLAGTSWGRVTLPCGTTANCSSLIFFYAQLPLTKNSLKPGASLVASVNLTTPGTAGPVSFKFLGIGGGLFTTADTPTINVVSGDAANFLITGSTGPIPAGGSSAFRLQMQNNATPPANVGFKGGTVHVVLPGTDPGASLVYRGVPSASNLCPTTGGDVYGLASGFADVPLPSTTAGAYCFSLVVTKTVAQSLAVSLVGSTPLVNGTYGPLTVSPGPATSISIDSIVDTSSTPALASPAAGQSFAVKFLLRDFYQNDTTLAASPGAAVTLTSNPVGINAGTGTTDVVLGASAAPGAVATSYPTAVPSLAVTASLTGPNAASATANTLVTGPASSAVLDPNAQTTLVSTGASVLFPAGSNGGTASVTSTFCTPAEITAGVCAASPTPNIYAVTGSFAYLSGGQASAAFTCFAADCPNLSHKVQRVLKYVDSDGDSTCEVLADQTIDLLHCTGDSDENEEGHRVYTPVLGTGFVELGQSDESLYVWLAKSSDAAAADPYQTLVSCNPDGSVPSPATFCLVSSVRNAVGDLVGTINFTKDPRAYIG